MKSHVLVRFGRWQDIIDEPMVEEPELYVLTAAMQHYAKGVAHATLGNFAEAERERERFHRHLARHPAGAAFPQQPDPGFARRGRRLARWRACLSPGPA